MSIYIVTRKTDGSEVYRYSAPAPIPWSGMEFATHDHIEQVAEAAAPVAVTDKRKTKLEYMNLFADAELAGIYSAAQVSPAVMVWLKKFEAATPDADGKAIDLSDPRTIGGLQALEQAGLLAAGRAQEILNG